MENYREQLRLLTQAMNQIDGLYYQAARKLGVKDNTLALLYALDDGKPHSQKQIGEEWLIPKTTINTIVREMETQGYLVLDEENHTREKTIRLTREGKDYASRYLNRLYEMEEQAMKDMLENHAADFVRDCTDFALCLMRSFNRCFSDEEIVD